MNIHIDFTDGKRGLGSEEQDLPNVRRTAKQSRLGAAVTVLAPSLPPFLKGPIHFERTHTLPFRGVAKQHSAFQSASIRHGDDSDERQHDERGKSRFEGKGSPLAWVHGHEFITPASIIARITSVDEKLESDAEAEAE
jgi:hypothetical protein